MPNKLFQTNLKKILEPATISLTPSQSHSQPHNEITLSHQSNQQRKLILPLKHVQYHHMTLHILIVPTNEKLVNNTDCLVTCLLLHKVMIVSSEKSVFLC